MAIIGTLWWALGTGRMSVKIRGTRHVLDLDWFCRWFLGRRVWLTLERGGGAREGEHVADGARGQESNRSWP